MKYTPRQPREGINYSEEHPLKEFLLLLFGVATLLGLLVWLALSATGYLVKLVPVAVEQQIFHTQLIPAQIQPTEPQHWQRQQQYLQQLVDQMQRAKGDSEYQFRVYVVEMETPNAFAIAGGYIGVSTCLLKTVQSENGLAMVLAHEMGHHYARDPLVGLGNGVVLGMLMFALTGLGGEQWLQSLIGEVSLLGMSQFSRQQERAADALGKAIITSYYGHAGGASEFFEAILQRDAKKGEQPFGYWRFLQTHPPTEQRIHTLRDQPVGELTPLPRWIQTPQQ